MGAVESITGADPRGKGRVICRSPTVTHLSTARPFSRPLPLALCLRYTSLHEYQKRRRDLGADAVGD